MAYTTIDRTGKWLLAASYPAGKVTVNPIDADGKVGVPPCQILTDRPKAHCVRLDAANEHAYCAVLEQDLILQMNFDAASGRLSPEYAGEIATKKGAGPRHLAFHPSGRFLYLITETTATIGAYAIDQENRHAQGAAIRRHARRRRPPRSSRPPPICTSRRTDGFFTAASAAATCWSGSASTRDKGTLTLAGRTATETTPRGFGIEPRGQIPARRSVSIRTT